MYPISEKKKPKTPIIILAILAIGGIFCFCYPSLAAWYNQSLQDDVISSYRQTAAVASETEIDALLAQAQAWNDALPMEGGAVELPDSLTDEYLGQLSIGNASAMGYLSILAIDVHLPIYHNAEDTTLQAGVGHVASSSLPIGGDGSHCVLSAHTGMADHQMFDQLDQMEIGDVFYIHVLDMTLAYQVDQILVVEPEEVNALYRMEGKDYCTLVTCTPIGVNSHRLLVRGVRVDLPDDYSEGNDTNTTKTPYDVSSRTPPVWLVIVVGVVLCSGITCLIIYCRYRKKHKHKP